MALDISLDLNNTGAAAHYWRITSAHIDHAAAAVTVWLHGWSDLATRHAGRAPLGALHIVLEAGDVPASDLHGATSAVLYQALKARAGREASAPASLATALAPIGAAVFATAKDC